MPGSDLGELVRRIGPLDIADASQLISQAAQGLEYAREHGFVHRDIKPSNLMLTQNRDRAGTSQAIVKILDLGLARALEQPAGSVPVEAELTATGQVMGTVDYMAPEQGGDAHHVDIRADVYSLGATLYKLLTGKSPFAEHAQKPMLRRMMAIANQEPPDIRTLRHDVPAPLADLIHRMLAKNPADRPAPIWRRCLQRMVRFPGSRSRFHRPPSMRHLGWIARPDRIGAAQPQLSRR